jgi:putative FmdB family regulatory protein
MPIYEFICNKCGEEFETILSSTDITDVNCQACKSPDIKKVLSSGSFKVGGSSASLPSSAPASGGCGRSGFS